MAGLPKLGSEPGLLAVASNVASSRARILYRHDPEYGPMDINFFFGEIEITEGRWELARDIQVGPGYIPHNTALTYDPTYGLEARSLFFGQVEGSSQELFVKHFDVEKYVWLDAVQIVGSKDRQAIKARKESHFAATQIPVGPHVSTVPTIVLYFIDDNSNVMEVLGTKSLEPGTMYDWRFGEIVARNVLPESRLAAVCEGKNRWVVYQQNNGKLGGAKNSGKGWTPFDVPTPSGLEKGSALGLSSSGENGLTYYFTQTGQIMAGPVVPPPSIPLPTPMPVVVRFETVGTHVKGTNIGALSFPGEMMPDGVSNTAHLISASELDTNRVVVERIRRSDIWPEAGRARWIFPGGIIMTPQTRKSG